MFPNIAVPALKVADFFKEPGSILSLCLLLNDYKPILDMASVYSAFYVYEPFTNLWTVLPLPSYMVCMYPIGASKGPLAIFWGAFTFLFLFLFSVLEISGLLFYFDKLFSSIVLDLTAL